MAKKKQNSPDQQNVVRDNERDEQNKRRFVDQSGLAAQDLPDAERGQNVVDPPEEMERRLPHQHGGARTDEHNYGDAGIRGQMSMTDADTHGNRGRN
jgi:hypothetical protein